MKHLILLLLLIGCSKQSNQNYYSYAPSIIYTENTWHEYFCSKGTEGIGDWDDIRHSTSNDLINWSVPQIYLVPNAYERSNCDPSVVRFNGYYYMFYGGNVLNVQTVIFVSRSISPVGPFLKYTQRGTWEQEPIDPKVIVWPFTANLEGVFVYGAGQPSVIVRNGKLLMWYMDDTAPYPNDYDLIYFTTSSDGVNWSLPIMTNVSNQSIEVKWDATNGNYVMFEIQNMHDNLITPDEGPVLPAYLDTRTSIDGITWSEPNAICDDTCFPHSGSNLGVSGDDQGQLIPSALIVRYAIPDSILQFVLTTFWYNK